MAIEFDFSDITLLVVDDMEDVRLLIADVAEELGMTVIQAESGTAGLELVAHSPPSLVLSDYNMPNMNGLEFLQKMQKIDDTTKLILFSGQVDVETTLSAIQLGVYDFITKPFDIERLKIVLINCSKLYQTEKKYFELLKKLQSLSVV